MGVAEVATISCPWKVPVCPPRGPKFETSGPSEVPSHEARHAPAATANQPRKPSTTGNRQQRPRQTEPSLLALASSESHPPTCLNPGQGDQGFVSIALRGQRCWLAVRQAAGWGWLASAHPRSGCWLASGLGLTSSAVVACKCLWRLMCSVFQLTTHHVRTEHCSSPESVQHFIVVPASAAISVLAAHTEDHQRPCLWMDFKKTALPNTVPEGPFFVVPRC